MHIVVHSGEFEETCRDGCCDDDVECQVAPTKLSDGCFAKMPRSTNSTSAELSVFTVVKVLSKQGEQLQIYNLQCTALLFAYHSFEDPQFQLDGFSSSAFGCSLSEATAFAGFLPRLPSQQPMPGTVKYLGDRQRQQQQ